MTRFAFIDRQRAHYDVTVLCSLLKVSRSGFYAWLRRPKSPRALADEVLTEQIREAFDSNRKVYGSPRIHVELADDGIRVGRKRVARLMREDGIVGCHRRKRSFSITKQDPKADAAPDLVDRSRQAKRRLPTHTTSGTDPCGRSLTRLVGRSLISAERTPQAGQPPSSATLSTRTRRPPSGSRVTSRTRKSGKANNNVVRSDMARGSLRLTA